MTASKSVQAAGVLHRIRISRNDSNFFLSNENKINKSSLQFFSVKWRHQNQCRRLAHFIEFESQEMTRVFSRQMITRLKNLKALSQVNKLVVIEGKQSLEAKIYNGKIKRRCRKTFRGYSSNNQLAKMEG